MKKLLMGYLNNRIGQQTASCCCTGGRALMLCSAPSGAGRGNPPIIFHKNNVLNKNSSENE